MSLNASYKPKQFNLSGLTGISDKTLEMHFKLYEGYVTNTNTLTEKIAAILADGKVDQEEMPAYSELTRRLGFEYNGMVLHEYYFGNMKRQARRRSGAARLAVPRTPSSAASRATTSGRPTSSASARCAASAGRSATWIPATRQHLQSLDHPARDRQRRRLRAAAGDGRVGARLPPRLQARRPAEVHRGVLRQHRLGRRRAAPPRVSSDADGRRRLKASLASPAAIRMAPVCARGVA